MSRTMLKDYKMGLISYDELLKTTTNIFTWNEWDESTLQNVEESVDYLDKDLINYMRQHKDNHANAVSTYDLQSLIAKLTEQVGSYEFELTPAGYETITVTYDAVSSEWFVANKFGHYLLEDDIKHEMYFKILALKEAYQTPVIVTVRTKEKYLHFLCY
jgi:hypothetical protein